MIGGEKKILILLQRDTENFVILLQKMILNYVFLGNFIAWNCRIILKLFLYLHAGMFPSTINDYCYCRREAGG